MRKTLVLTLALSALVACTSNGTNQDRERGSLRENINSASSSAMDQTRAGFAEAAMSPLEDLNLRRDEIPGVLKSLESPYNLPTKMTCSDVTYYLQRLESVLGADWDAPEPDDRLRTEQLADSAAEATLKALSSEASSMIPFRGMVRKASGAESHAKAYARAFKIGAQQRAYLKGYGLALGCDAPARPSFAATATPTPVSDDILFKGDTPQPLPEARPVPRSSVTISSTTSAPKVQHEGLETVPQQ